jgi:isopentenyl phosphate kinase
VLKLGGSVVTEKRTRETVDEASLTVAAEAIAAATIAAVGTDTSAAATDGIDDDPERLVLVHGGGSFGHPAASEHGISSEAGSRDAGAARAVHGAMGRLNGRVVDALADRGVPAFPVHPLSLAHRDREGDLALPTGGVKTMLDEGFVPVLHGDVLAHAGRGVTVVSGDELAVTLAERLDADRVGLCTGVSGVLDVDGRVVERIDSFERVADSLSGSDATDVTGGMAGKVRALLALDAPASVFGLDDLEDFLAGGSPGTRIG